MKKLALFLLLAISIVVVHAQTTVNDANAQVRTVSTFSGLSVATGIKVYLTQSEKEAVAVSASNTAYRDNIITEVVDGVLKIYYKKGSNNKNIVKGSMQLQAYVSVSTLTSLKVSSGANVETTSKLTVGDLDVNLSSGANVKAALSGANIKVSQSSGAVSKFSGSAKKLVVSAESGSNFGDDGFSADVCDADASSGSSIDVTVNKELSASASSGGNIRYSGSPVVKKSAKSSGGSIKNVK